MLNRFRDFIIFSAKSEVKPKTHAPESLAIQKKHEQIVHVDGFVVSTKKPFVFSADLIYDESVRYEND